ncbi:hypothetical protein [Streptomyces sp. NPDC007905]
MAPVTHGTLAGNASTARGEPRLAALGSARLYAAPSVLAPTVLPSARGRR